MIDKTFNLINSNMEDVRKTGYLKKLKTMKKKFFILRAESESGPARLEYHDSEKKWKSSTTPPKRVIHLKTCFNINRKLDTKHKWVIALYTKDDCFAISFDSENELEAWLTTLLELQHGDEWLGINEKPKPNYEHVWEVSVKNKGLGSSKGILGPYRLCLTERTLTLIQTSSNEPLSFEFPMMSIRRCGHSESFFFMEVGRSTATGAGELWMLTEDTLIAQNMHEAILNAMKSSNSKEDLGPWPRSRSQSANDSSKPISSHIRRQTLNVISPHTVDPRARCDSMPTRPRTISDGHKDAPGHSRSSISYDSRPQKTIFNRTISCSPPYSLPGSSLMGAGGEGNTGSFFSVSDGSNSHLELLHVKDSPLEPSIEEEGSAYIAMSYNDSSTSLDEYMDMQPGRTSAYSPTSPSSSRSTEQVVSERSSVASQSWLAHQNSSSIPPSTDYLEMSSPGTVTVSNTAPIATPDGYMPMSPVGSLLAREIKENSNGQGKDGQSTVEGYVPMAPLGDSLLQSVKSNSPPEDEGYMDMAPLSRSLARNSNLETSDVSSRRSSDSPSTDMCFAEYPLDKVQAYFTPSEEEEPMVRACSIGSRADCNFKKNRLEVATESCRTRAFSVGSNVKRNIGGGSKLGYGANIRGKMASSKLNPMVSDSNGIEIGGTSGSGGTGGKKSMSAPVLGTSPQLNSIWQTNGITYGKKQSEDLMEMAFPKSQASNDYRRSNSSLSGRPRAGSKSSHIRLSSKNEHHHAQSNGTHKAKPDHPVKASDYLVMEASAKNNRSSTDDVTSSERKCSLPISIAESTSIKDNRRLSDLALNPNSGEYVNIDPTRSLDYRYPSSLGNSLGVSPTVQRPTSSSTVRFNPEYVNLRYGLDLSTKPSISESKSEIEEAKEPPPSKINNETESDYTVMAPGYPVSKTRDESLSNISNQETDFLQMKSKQFPEDVVQICEEEAERQLNYAALDLPPSTTQSFDESEAKSKSTSPILSQGSPTINNPTTGDEASSLNAPSFYAQIDFVKSEGLRSQTQNAAN